MKAASFLLADAAVVLDGKLYVHGGGWDRIYTATLPSTHPSLSLAAVLEIDYTEAPDEHELHLQLIGPDQEPCGVGAIAQFATGHAPGSIKGAPAYVPFAMTIPFVTFHQAGRHRWELSVNDERLATAWLHIELPRQPLEMPNLPGLGSGS